MIIKISCFSFYPIRSSHLILKHMLIYVLLYSVKLFKLKIDLK